jgi:hypothetical protein
LFRMSGRDRSPGSKFTDIRTGCTSSVNNFLARRVLPYDAKLAANLAAFRSEPMFMLISLIIRATVMAVVLTARLMYLIFKAMIMLTVALAAAISTSRASRQRKPIQR